MKKLSLTILAALLAYTAAFAQNHLSERVYVSSDRDVYLAGDDFFFSAFCLDMTSGGLSGASAVAYIEICSPEGPVQTAKVALKSGRGSGLVSLKNTIPTGNYRVVAYTAQCFNEQGYDFEEGSKVIAIINPFTTERSSSGADIIDDGAYSELKAEGLPSAGNVSAAFDGVLTVKNSSGKPVTLSVAISHDDGIFHQASANPVTFRKEATKGTSFTDSRELEYEGEIVRARVRGINPDSFDSVAGAETFFSVPGRISDVYSSILDNDGLTSFYTENVYGDVEAFLEVYAPGSGCHLDVESPFKSVRASGLEPLPLAKCIEDRIRERSVAMQVHEASGADSLYCSLPVLSKSVFDGDGIEYVLDDYTRFPLMEELFIEFIKEARVKKTDDGRVIVVYLQDTYKPATFVQQQPALALLDGVPVLDQEKLFSYDPLLVERIVVYPYTYNLGHWSFSGIVNFITYKRNMPSFDFDENARVVDFQGVSFPMMSNLPSGNADFPDMRETVLWHPQVEIGPGESRLLDYVLPSYGGRFNVVIEGFDSEGEPQYFKSVIRGEGNQ